MSGNFSLKEIALRSHEALTLSSKNNRKTPEDYIAAAYAKLLKQYVELNRVLEVHEIPLQARRRDTKAASSNALALMPTVEPPPATVASWKISPPRPYMPRAA